MSETDPLLPKGSSAPEISGYGFSKAQYQAQNEVLDPDKNVEEDEEQSIPGYEGFSPLRTLVVLFTVVVGCAVFITLLFPGASHSPSDQPVDDAVTIRARVNKILSENPLIGPYSSVVLDVNEDLRIMLDGHNDLAILIRFVYQNDLYNESFIETFGNGGMFGHVDIPRLKDGKAGGAFWSAFTPCPPNGTDFSDSNYAESVSMTLSQLDVIRRLTEYYPKVFSDPKLNSSSALAKFKSNHQLISPIGIEGLHQIGNSFSNLRLYHSFGVKYATLTHNCNNAFADAALTTSSTGKTIAGPPHWYGLSPLGQLMIQEMNRIGMLVDLSHVSKETMLDALSASKAPVMFSHSSAYALCPHPRNVPDDVLHLVKKNNGIVMVNFSPDFISCTPCPPDSDTGIPPFYPQNNTLHQVARHIVHIGGLIGYDHVGLGSDFDGILNTPVGLEDVSKFPDLVAELLKMGVRDEDAVGVVGGNVLRVWGEVEGLGEKMRSKGVRAAQDPVKRWEW